MYRLDERQKSRIKSPIFWFCFLSLTGIMLTVMVLFATHGEYFARLFYADSMDTGMDFFHSIEYTKYRVPYEHWETLYPPLANLLFYGLFRFVPEWQHSHWSTDYYESINMRGTDCNLRSWQPTMLLFMVFLILTAALLIYMVQRYLNQEERNTASMASLCCLFSYGMLYAYERGNIVILACLGTMFFVLFRNSERAVMRELSLLALAFSAGIKLYPAVFGVLLLQDKRYREALRTVVYGILLFVLPIFCFKEGLMGFEIFFTKLTQHSASKTLNPGYSFDGIVTSAMIVIKKLFGIPVNAPFLMNVMPRFNIIVMGIMLLLSFLMKKNWQKVLCCCCAMMFYQSQGVYGTVFFLVPLVCFLREEKTLTAANIVPFLTLCAVVILLPVFNKPDALFTYNSLRFQLCQVVFAVYICLQAILNLPKFQRKKK